MEVTERKEGFISLFTCSRFPYLDRPEERFILTALKQLYQYDAIDRYSKCYFSVKCSLIGCLMTSVFSKAGM